MSSVTPPAPDTAGSGKTSAPTGWSVTAEIAPGKPAAVPGPRAHFDVPGPDWTASVAALSGATKWMVTAFAAVGAVLFAKGFVSTPQLSWTDNRMQLLVALGCGAVAVCALAALVGVAVKTLLPSAFELTTLPRAVKQKIEQQTGVLPWGITSLDDFWEKYGKDRRYYVSNVAELRGAEFTLSDPHAAAGARSEAEIRRQAALRGIGHLSSRLLVFEDVTRTLLGRAQWWTQSEHWRKNGPAMIVAAVIAAVSGIGYQLALATPPSKAGASAAAPVVGTLIRQPGSAGDQLWSQLGLERCQVDPRVPQVAVVVHSGSGTAASPYSVTTLESVGTCRVMTFSVVDDVARVVVPQPATVTVTYPPSTSMPTP